MLNCLVGRVPARETLYPLMQTSCGGQKLWRTLMSLDSSVILKALSTTNLFNDFHLPLTSKGFSDHHLISPRGRRFLGDVHLAAGIMPNGLDTEQVSFKLVNPNIRQYMPHMCSKHVFEHETIHPKSKVKSDLQPTVGSSPDA